MDTSLPPSEMDPLTDPWTPSGFPWSLSFLSESSPPTLHPPLSSALVPSVTEEPAPKWAPSLWALSSPRSPLGLGSSAFSVEQSIVIILLSILRRHAFGHGILKGRAMESGGMLRGRLSTVWDSTSRAASLRVLVQSAAHRLKVNVSDLSADDQLFYRAICQWSDSVGHWRALRSVATQRDEVIGGIAILAAYLKETA